MDSPPQTPSAPKQVPFMEMNDVEIASQTEAIMNDVISLGDSLLSVMEKIDGKVG